MTEPQDIARLSAEVARATRALAQVRREEAESRSGRGPALGAAYAVGDSERRLVLAKADLERAVARRKRDLATLHMAAAALGLDEETRRAQITRISGGRTGSSGELTATERARLLGEYRAAGWLGGSRGRPRLDALDGKALLRKVDALLADQRLPWGYAEAILRRQRGISDKHIACPPQSASREELRALIAALWRRAKAAEAR